MSKLLKDFSTSLKMTGGARSFRINYYLSPFSFSTRFTVCLILPMKKFISSEDSIGEYFSSAATLR